MISQKYNSSVVHLQNDSKHNITFNRSKSPEYHKNG